MSSRSPAARPALDVMARASLSALPGRHDCLRRIGRRVRNPVGIPAGVSVIPSTQLSKS